MSKALSKRSTRHLWGN